jgi:hypothetical protein
VQEYLDTLDDAAWGGASEVMPKFISKSDPAAQWTGAHKGHAFFAYANNYLIDLKAAIIVDVEATRAIRQAEVGAAKTMIDRTAVRFGLKLRRLSGDSAYGSAEILGWMVKERNIEPHVALWDKSERTDGTFSRSDFIFDAAANAYTCPGGKLLQKYRRSFAKPRIGVTKHNTLIYNASQRDCAACTLKARCCPGQPRRKIARSIHEAARDVVRNLKDTPAYLQSRRERKKGRDALRPSQAHPQAQPLAAARSPRCTRRVPARRHCSEPSEIGQSGSRPSDERNSFHSSIAGADHRLRCRRAITEGSSLIARAAADKRARIRARKRTFSTSGNGRLLPESR